MICAEDRAFLIKQRKICTINASAQSEGDDISL